MATIKLESVDSGDGKIVLKAISTATADEFIFDIKDARIATIQIIGLSADTIVFSLSVDPLGSGYSTILENVDGTYVNPFSNPQATISRDIPVVNFQKLKMVRTGVADGTVNIFISLLLDQ